MKKQFKKILLIFISYFFSFIFLFNGVLSNENKDNYLKITNKKLNDIKINNYDNEKKYNLYFFENDFNKQSNLIFNYIFTTRTSFYESLKEEIKQKIEQKLNSDFNYFVFLENNNSKNFINFFGYFSLLNNESEFYYFYIKNFDFINAKNKIELINTNALYYNFKFKLNFKKGDESKYIEFKNFFSLNNKKIIKKDDNFKIEILLNKENFINPLFEEVFMLSFSNIIFNKIAENIYKVNLLHFNIFNFRKEDFLAIFNLENLSLENIFYELDIKNLSLKVNYFEVLINNEYQNQKIIYTGNFNINFENLKFEIDDSIIKLNKNIYEIEKEFIIQNLMINPLIEIISDWKINKNFDLKTVTITPILDLNKIEKLIFKSYIQNFFNNFEHNIFLNTKRLLNINDAFFKKTFLKKFDIKNVFVSPNSEEIKILKVNNILIKNIYYKKNAIKIFVSALVQKNNNNFNINEDILINEFYKYDLNNFENFILNNFYKDKVNFDVVKLDFFLSDQNNWKKLGNFSNDLLFKNYKIIQKKKKIIIFYDIYDHENKFLLKDYKTINLLNEISNSKTETKKSLDSKDEHDNKKIFENEKIQKHILLKENWYYFLLIIPILCFVIFLFKKITNHLRFRKYKI